MKHTNWVRRFEHLVLRIASLVFSVVSAHAILWFFSALNHVDHLQPVVTWGIALGFGVLGYFVSRGLAHRLLNREPVRAYIFICGVFELVEVVCNYAMAAVAVQWISWLGLVPPVQRGILTFLTYVVLSIIPVVTVMLAWVDMDLERAKQGYEVRGFGMGLPGSAPGKMPVSGFGGARAPVQPKAPPVPNTGMYPTGPAPAPSYQQGYAGASMPPLPPRTMAQSAAAPAAPSVPVMVSAPASPASAAMAAAPVEQAGPAGWWNKATSRLPFGSRAAAQVTNPS